MLNQSKYSDFGLCVKTKLLQMGKEQKWLEELVSEMTGLYPHRPGNPGGSGRPGFRSQSRLF